MVGQRFLISATPVRVPHEAIFSRYKMDAKYSLLSLNTGGVKTNDRRDLLVNYCDQIGADFSILQETHTNISSIESIKGMWDGEVIISPGTSQTKGLIVLARKGAP